MYTNAQILAQTLYRPPMSLIILKNTTINQGELWLGNMKAAKNIKTLKEFQISTVITIANNLDICYVPEDGITHHNYQEAPDIPTFKIQNLFEPVIENITLGLLRGNVFVHCVAGISRSATLVIAYLMSSRGWGYEKALYFVKERRNIKPNPGFLTQLITFSREIQQNLKQIEQQKIQPKPLPYSIQKEELKMTKTQNKIQQRYLNKVATQIPIPQCNIDLFNRSKQQISIMQSKSSEKFPFQPNQSGNNNTNLKTLQQSSASEYFQLSKSQDILVDDKEDLNTSMFGRNIQKRQTPCGLYNNKDTIVSSYSNNILDLIVRQTSQPIKQSQKIVTEINKNQNQNYFASKPCSANLENKQRRKESIKIDQFLKYTTPQKENASMEKMRKAPPSASSLYKACYSFL